MLLGRFRWLAMLALVMGAYGYTQNYLRGHLHKGMDPELLVSIPWFVQTLFSVGDRYLAANISGFRILVADTSRMVSEDYAVQARLQSDVAWLNPAHEDNYYIAANILPWGGQVDAAENVLRRAVAGRPNDFLPAFHVGFINYHFRKQPAEGARWLLLAAERASDPGDSWGLQTVAAKWIERGYETSVAAKIVRNMVKGAPQGGFRTYLGLRAERLESLALLRSATDRYRSTYGHPPQQLRDLITAGLISELPRDPLGPGFILNAKGEPTYIEQ
jgi:hypothetical protein